MKTETLLSKSNCCPELLKTPDNTRQKKYTYKNFKIYSYKNLALSPTPDSLGFIHTKKTFYERG